MELLLEPFAYEYMTKAIWISALVGGTCAFLSCYLMLKGWSLMGDALAHSVVPGVALAYLLALPFAAGAFISGLFAALSMTIVQQKTKLREDAVIGLVFTAFFALGLLIISIYPTSINIRDIILGNVLAFSIDDAGLVVLIWVWNLVIVFLMWRYFKAVFFDEHYARSLALPVIPLKILFFVLLSAASVAALQTVGACLVIAAVITPGATAYLLTDQFHRLIIIAVTIGAVTSGFGAYLSYFIDGVTGGVIVCLQTLLFLTAFFFAPKYGAFGAKKRHVDILESGS